MVLLLAKKWKLLAGILLFTVTIFTQLILWRIQTGHFIFDSYHEEGFNFLAPQFFNILFSYKKGLFIYAPVLFIACGGLLALLLTKRYYLFSTWLFFFIMLTYILSSWHAWEYGCSFGSRPYIDFYAVFFIAFAFLLQYLRTWLKGIIIILALLTAPICVIQAKQYKEYILLWIGMDKEKYWTVFLEQAPRFKGLLWKKQYSFTLEKTLLLKSVDLSTISIKPKSKVEIFSDTCSNISQFSDVNIIQVSLENEFNSKENARLRLVIYDIITRQESYQCDVPLIQYSEQGLNKFQRGEFNYEFSPMTDFTNKKISLTILTDANMVTLKNAKINFIKYF